MGVLASRSAGYADPFCDTLVVAEPTAAGFRTGKMPRLPVETALMAALDRSEPGRFDLLTHVHGAHDSAHDIIVEDIGLAVRNHQVRNVVVTLFDGSRAVAKRLSSRLDLPHVDFHHIDFRGIVEHDPTQVKHLAAGCMDWRHHGADGNLRAALEREFGESSYAVFTTAGGAVWAAHPELLRGQFLIQSLVHVAERSPCLTHVHLYLHTDCAVYGGHAAFPDFKTELARLTTDARAAEENVRAAMDKAGLGVEVIAGIIMIENHRVANIVRL
jgi:hypothetical protein